MGFQTCSLCLASNLSILPCSNELIWHALFLDDFLLWSVTLLFWFSHLNFKVYFIIYLYICICVYVWWAYTFMWMPRGQRGCLELQTEVEFQAVCEPPNMVLAELGSSGRAACIPYCSAISPAPSHGFQFLILPSPKCWITGLYQQPHHTQMLGSHK